jgi:anaerobic selenocysteine-containing dehydrogenase
VVVLNSTTSNGLATKVKNQLVADGLVVESVGDSPTQPQATTLIIDKSAGKKPATAAELAKLFGNHLTSTNTYGLTYNADFIIILGNNQAANSSAAPTIGQ